MRNLIFFNPFILSTTILIVSFVSSFSFSAGFCNLSSINQVAKDFLKKAPAQERVIVVPEDAARLVQRNSVRRSSRQLPLAGNSAYDSFRKAYNTGHISGDNQFVSYIDENGKRVSAEVLSFKSNGEVKLREIGRRNGRSGDIVYVSGKELNDIRVSATAKQNFLDIQENLPLRSVETPEDAARLVQRSSVRRSSRQLPLEGNSAYDGFRKAYNARHISGDNQFVSYIDENGKRVSAKFLRIKSNGEVELREIGRRNGRSGDIVYVSGKELNDIRVSATAKQNFLDIQENLPLRSVQSQGAVPRAPPSRGPALRTDIYNRSYRVNADLQPAKKKFEQVADTYMFGQRRRKYFGDSYWYQWGFSETPLQGWKFHVSAKPENMHEIAEKMLPVLQREGMHHKIVHPKAFDRYVNRIGRNDSQQGKFITVYPSNKEEARRYAQILKQVMKENNFGRDDFINIPNQYEISPGIFVRYGRMAEGNLKRSNGMEIPMSDDHILTPDGRVIEDPRGERLPDFVQGEMLELF